MSAPSSAKGEVSGDSDHHQDTSSSPLAKRMSWLFTSPWHGSAPAAEIPEDNAISESPRPLQPHLHMRRLSTHRPSVLLMGSQNPTTLSAPGRPMQRTTNSTIAPGRRRGTSFSSIGSGGTNIGLPLERSGHEKRPMTMLPSHRLGMQMPSGQNPEEYAVQMIFLHFTEIADKKLNWALTFPLVWILCFVQLHSCLP